MFTLNISTDEHQVKTDKVYDLLIIGGGPAGLSAAIYSARKGLSVGILGEKIGGQVQDTSSVENYMGFEFVSGQGLAESFEKHVKSLDVHMTSDIRVKEIQKGSVFSIIADNFQTYQSKTVLVTTGSKSRQLGIPGENDFYSKGVSYCAICDGPLYQDKVVTVVGGGNSAVEAAIDLSKIAKHVHLVHRSTLRADQILVDKLEKIDKVDIHLGTQVETIKGTSLVEGIDLIGQTQGYLPTDGVLIEIGYVPNSQFLEVDKNNRGEILVDSHHQTSVQGIFAAGDVTTERYKQIIIAASEGAKAALSINEYLYNE
jgi:alkyl hydroperoxide reductase subunit F